MPRTVRIDVGGEVYHILNRANVRVQIFDEHQDYLHFEKILRRSNGKIIAPAKEMVAVPISPCIKSRGFLL